MREETNNSETSGKPAAAESVSANTDAAQLKENTSTSTDSHVDENKDDTHNQLSSAVVSSTQDVPSPSAANRPYTEVETDKDNGEDEIAKKKKRKEIEKDVSAKPHQSRVVGRAPLTGTKPPGPASKTGATPLGKLAQQGSAVTSTKSSSTASVSNKNNNTTSKVNMSQSHPLKSNSSNAGKYVSASPANSKTGDSRKSPCLSPKSSSQKESAEMEIDDSKVPESTGPKVPPLKIVIPGGSGGASCQQEGEGSGHQRGGSKGRGGSAILPYVIPSNASDDGMEDKDEKKSGAGDEKGGTPGQRILRSHRTTDGEKDKDKDRASPHRPASPAHASGTKSPPPSSSNDESSCAGPPPASAPSTHHHHPAPSERHNVDLHPRKRKLKVPKDHHTHNQTNNSTATTTTHTETTTTTTNVTNSNPYQMHWKIRKQIERRQKSVFPVQPKPPQGFENYLMNKCTYILQKNVKPEPNLTPPHTLPLQMTEEYKLQEKERHKLRIQHLVEKEKLVLAVEQEILRVHGRAARGLANQPLPYSACTFLKDKEVYNIMTPEQEEKERNAQRPRHNGRIFLSWLQDVDDKWEKIKEAMVRRHHMEAEALHGIQTLKWGWKLVELGLCDRKVAPRIDQTHVPMVHVSDDFHHKST